MKLTITSQETPMASGRSPTIRFGLSRRLVGLPLAILLMTFGGTALGSSLSAQQTVKPVDLRDLSTVLAAVSAGDLHAAPKAKLAVMTISIPPGQSSIRQRTSGTTVVVVLSGSVRIVTDVVIAIYGVAEDGTGGPLAVAVDPGAASRPTTGEQDVTSEFDNLRVFELPSGSSANVPSGALIQFVSQSNSATQLMLINLES